MTNSKATRIFQSLLILLFSTTVLTVANAQQDLEDYSVLPENLTGSITTNPNVLIILDTSSSMGYFRINNGPTIWVEDPETGAQYRDFNNANRGRRGFFSTSYVDHYDASSSFSNSFKVREAMRNIINSDAFKGRLNVGLMGFGQSRCQYFPANNQPFTGKTRINSTCRDAFGNIIRVSGNPGSTGLGVLRANLQLLNTEHQAKLTALLGAEPSPWNDDNVGFDRNGYDYVLFPSGQINGVEHPYFTDGEVLGNETPMTTLPFGSYGNGTPLGGSLETAFRYLFRNDPTAAAQAPNRLLGGLVSREAELGTETVVDSAGNSSEVPIDVAYLSQAQCEGPLTVILLTDGDPSQLPPSNLNTGIGSTTAQGAGTAIASAVNAATRIRYRGYGSPNSNVSEDDQVDVYVIGFNLANQNAANQIAAAGGTGQAILTSSTAEVEAAFSGIFSDILERGASRSGLSIIATPDSATGSFVQPSFTPLTQETVSSGPAEQVVWTGNVRNFFIDKFGNFREDSIPAGNTEGNDVLDSSDKGFRILYDEDTDLTYVERFDVGGDGTISNVTGSPDGSGGFTGGFIAVDDLEAIWNASDQLNRLSDSLAQVSNNRPYTTAVSTSNSGRRIYTWLDNNADGTYDVGEGNTFTWNDSSAATTQINPSNKGIFDLPLTANTDDDAEDLVNFIRGFQDTNSNPYRNRIIDSYKFLLGDIVHSTPVQVDEPIPLAFSTNPLNTDDLRDSYEPFADHYVNRRKMVYVGANDGMLHAFNGGFWDIDSVAGTVTVSRQISGEANHELGDELWAFIPNAVLPHLKFLQDPDYEADEHIAFVDGSLESFEVKIFDGETGNCTLAAGAPVPSTCKYINGWGTILVGGLRFGGADYTADFDGDGTIETHETTRSSFFIIDITDPESAPVLLDELTSPDLELTVSKPALVRLEGSSSTDREYRLVFGSGPNELDTATNTTGNAASLFVYDLKDRDGLTKVSLTGAASTSFVGDMTTVDWNQDDIDDAIYFGTVAGTVEFPTGKLYRSTITVGSLSDTVDSNVIFDPGQPIQYQPVAPEDHPSQNDKYILFGTGRIYSLEDANFNYSPRNRLFGLKESFVGSILSNPITFGSSPIASSSQILDVTGANPNATDEGDVIINSKTRAEILDDFEDETTAPVYRGWEFDLPVGTSRLSARPVTLEELSFFTDYQPQDPTTVTAEQCLPEGGSFLSVFDYRTGLFPSSQRLEFGESANTGDTTTNFLNFQVSSSLLGEADILIIGDDGQGNTKFKFLAPGSNQEITDFDALLKSTVTVPTPIESGRKSWREISL
ncbi:MAG: PilC/PilY family type IV pilus protein [Pseudomonadota bacterium]